MSLRRRRRILAGWPPLRRAACHAQAACRVAASNCCRRSRCCRSAGRVRPRWVFGVLGFASLSLKALSGDGSRSIWWARSKVLVGRAWAGPRSGVSALRRPDGRRCHAAALPVSPARGGSLLLLVLMVCSALPGVEARRPGCELAINGLLSCSPALLRACSRSAGSIRMRVRAAELGLAPSVLSSPIADGERPGRARCRVARCA